MAAANDITSWTAAVTPERRRARRRAAWRRRRLVLLLMSPWIVGFSVFLIAVHTCGSCEKRYL